MNYTKYLIAVYAMLALVACEASDKIDVVSEIKSYFGNHTNVKASVKSYGYAKKQCKSNLIISSKQPIKPSNRWIVDVECSGSWKAKVTLETRVLANEYHSIRTIRKKELITPTNTKIKKIWSTKVVDQKEIMGRVSRKTIPANTKIKYWQTAKSYLVRKKQKLIAIVSTKDMKLSVEVVALEKGNLYDIIKVKNSSSGTEMSAEIIGKGKVRMIKYGN